MKFLKNWIYDHVSISHELIGAFIGNPQLDRVD